MSEGSDLRWLMRPHGALGDERPTVARPDLIWQHDDQSITVIEFKHTTNYDRLLEQALSGADGAPFDLWLGVLVLDGDAVTAMTKTLRARLAERGHALKYSHVRDTLSAALGFRDPNALAARLKAHPLILRPAPGPTDRTLVADDPDQLIAALNEQFARLVRHHYESFGPALRRDDAVARRAAVAAAALAVGELRLDLGAGPRRLALRGAATAADGVVLLDTLPEDAPEEAALVWDTPAMSIRLCMHLWSKHQVSLPPADALAVWTETLATATRPGKLPARHWSRSAVADALAERHAVRSTRREALVLGATGGDRHSAAAGAEIAALARRNLGSDAAPRPHLTPAQSVAVAVLEALFKCGHLAVRPCEPVANATYGWLLDAPIRLVPLSALRLFAPRFRAERQAA